LPTLDDQVDPEDAQLLAELEQRVQETELLSRDESGRDRQVLR